MNGLLLMIEQISSDIDNIRIQWNIDILVLEIDININIKNLNKS